MNLEEVLRRLIAEDAAVRRLRGQIERGKGSFADAVRCLFREADLLGGLMRRNILSVPEGDRAALLDTLLRQQHAETFALLSEVQAQMDAQNGLHLAAQKAEYPAERVAKAGSALEDKTVPDEVIQRRAEAVSSNIAKSMSDDFFRKNAEFRSSAGLKCWIVRDAATGCCPWCTDMAGRYAYGDEPGDVYGRHDNCSCTVTYESGRQRQDVWSKRSWEAPAADAGADAPTVFYEERATRGEPPPIKLSQSQGAAIQSANGLTNPGGDGKMNTDGFTPAATIAAAEQFARDVLGIKNVSYGKANLQVVNEWNRGLATALAQFPELLSQISFTGTITERNELIYNLATAYYTDQCAQKYPGWSEKSREKRAEKHALKVYRSYIWKDYSSVYAVSNEDERPFLAGIHGVAFNELILNNNAMALKRLQDEVQDKFHPVGCDTIKAILDHEIGHVIDKLVGARRDPIIRGIIDSMTEEQLTNELSRYSWDNDSWNNAQNPDDKYAEAIAEAWSEYQNNPHCRSVAMRIAKRMEELYAERGTRR